MKGQNRLPGIWFELMNMDLLICFKGTNQVLPGYPHLFKLGYDLRSVGGTIILDNSHVILELYLKVYLKSILYTNKYLELKPTSFTWQRLLVK